jgi:transcriptional regulator with GAF, ATPase, and Fis domain
LASCRCAAIFDEVLASGQPRHDLPGLFQHRSGERVPVTLSVDPLPEGAVALVRAVAVERVRAGLADGELAGIVSRSPRVQRILDVLPTIADSRTTVLLLGESGTGKELFARALHVLSPRRERPFVAVNCGALPENLLESELFGYVRGAFTDARDDKPGRFARAEGGTLFLDEIGDMPPALQVKLLRVLQEQEYEPLGATAPRRADVRVVCATNRDLAAEVRDGRFRADLYYRINVVELRLPSLAERREDIPLLVQRFIETFNARNGRSLRGISQAALARLMTYPFPGNIRELENIVEHALLLCPHDEIQEGCLPTVVLDDPGLACAVGGPAAVAARSATATGGEDRRLLVETLRRFHGHRRRSAQALGIDPATLWRRMKRWGIDETTLRGGD